jgi:hypothetical protein
MYPEYMLPDLWVQQVMAEQQKRARAIPAISDDAPAELPRRVSWWRRAFAVVVLRPSRKHAPAVAKSFARSWTMHNLILGLLLSAFALGAQSSTPLTPDQVRTRFVNAGYQVGPPASSWTDGSTSFVVDSDDERVLVVVVYPDVEAAQSARQASETRDPEYWWQNVGVVETVTAGPVAAVDSDFVFVLLQGAPTVNL